MLMCDEPKLAAPEKEAWLRENDFLRGLLSKLNIPCMHCGETNMGHCPHGFPGCAQADDLYVADDETMKRLLAENRALKAELAKLKG